MPILLEQAPLQNTKNALTTIAVPQQPQLPLDELIPPPVLVPKLQMTKSPPAVPFHATHMEPLPPLQLQPIINLNHYHWKCSIALLLT